ncbi:MAG TPA: hypothetical protein ENK06_09790 [Gammaproteobacteria bacterium]|nr:hypothetical protein [Gammaproteobacteria bacterium]
MSDKHLRSADGYRLNRWSLLTGFALTLVIIFLAGVTMRILGETGGSNSYAILAESFLNARLYAESCFDVDCAIFEGRTYIIFPPFPAIIVAPFVAFSGKEFAGFIPLSLMMVSLAAYLWWRIIRFAGRSINDTLWFVLAFVFATPLYYVLIRSDGIWFFAQATAFLLVTLSLHETLVGRRFVLAGLFLGMAFLTRQMSIFYLPFLFVCALEENEKLFSLNKSNLILALKLGLPVAVSLGIYLVYNEVRFGNPLDTGYGYITSTKDTFINHRIHDLGLFSNKYVTFNAFYLFLQGFHVEFGGPYLTKIMNLDSNGASLLAASPFVMLLFFTPLRRDFIIGFMIIAVMVIFMLFYHSNGYSQYNVQRYTLDWLPIAFLMLIVAVSHARMKVFKILVSYALVLNIATLAVLAVIK